MNSTWTALFCALLAVTVYAATETDNYKQELVDAGVTPDTAQGICDILAKHSQDGNDPNLSGKDIFNNILSETNAYIKTRPAEDQTAYENFVKDKTAEFQNPDSDDAADE